MLRRDGVVRVCVQIEEQRAYFRAVKDFQLACDKNETLLAQAKALQQQS